MLPIRLEGRTPSFTASDVIGEDRERAGAFSVIVSAVDEVLQRNPCDKSTHIFNTNPLARAAIAVLLNDDIEYAKCLFLSYAFIVMKQPPTIHFPATGIPEVEDELQKLKLIDDR